MGTARLLQHVAFNLTAGTTALVRDRSSPLPRWQARSPKGGRAFLRDPISVADPGHTEMPMIPDDDVADLITIIHHLMAAQDALGREDRMLRYFIAMALAVAMESLAQTSRS